tara:strand:- start:9167 stop:9337 length:171 start_codon:yes stop_codon:yes gene_type:complete
MGPEQLIPAMFLIAVLILILPSFLKSNSAYKQLFKNFFVWSIIVVIVVIVSILNFK